MLSIIFSLTKNIVIPPQKMESIHKNIGCIQSNDKYNNYLACLENNELNTCIEKYTRYDCSDEVNKCPQEITADNFEKLCICLVSSNFNKCLERLAKLEEN